MILFVAAGVLSYKQLGREEDPSFSIKTMIVRTSWPGATIDDTMLQITDRIEKKLQETPALYYLKSETKPGVSTIYVNVLDSTPKEAIPDIWYQVRKKVADIKGTLPQGILGPSFNDEFGDVFGIIYAFTAEGFTHRELRDYVERIRTQILTIKNAAKAQLIGAQDQKFYLEFDTHQLAGLGVSRDDVISSLQEQNAVTPSGVVQTGLEKYAIPRLRCIQLCRRPEAHQSLRQWQILPSRRRRLDKQRLFGSAAADVPVQWRTGDRARHLDGAGRQ